MNFREWAVRHLPARQSVLDIARDLNAAEQEIHLDWFVNGDVMAAWDHPRFGQGWFSVHRNEDGRFALFRDVLVRARTFPLGVYDHLDQAQREAEKVARKVQEQYA